MLLGWFWFEDGEGRNESLHLQQIPFRLQASAIAGQRAVAADDAVAGRDDADGVGSIGVGHGSDGLRNAKVSCHLAVGKGGAVWDAQQLFPNPFLELRPDEKQWKVKRGALSAKVFVELLAGGIGGFRRQLDEICPKHLLQAVLRCRAVPAVGPVAEAKLPLEGAEEQRAARRFISLYLNVFQMDRVPFL